MSTTVDRAAPVSSDVPFLDVTGAGFTFDSPEVMSAQDRSWYAQTPVGPLVLRYAQAQEVLRDRRFDHNGRGYMERNGIIDGPVFDWYVRMIVNQDGDDHRRLRGLLVKAFTPRMIDGLRPFIRATAERLTGRVTERLAAGGVCEFVEDFANPLPLAVMCELLGVPPADYATFSTWTTDVGLVFSLSHGGDIPARVRAAVVGLFGYADMLIDDKAKRPGTDLISALVLAQRTEGTVSRDELRNLVVTLVFAAHDTTRHQLANAMVTFSEHPDQWTVLAQRPELAAQAVEELMRWRPSANMLFRSAAEDIEYQGLQLPQGTFLNVCVPAAQRDPRAFPGGGSFDITVHRSAPVLQFGSGPHHCLGAVLARTEISEALAVLTGRLGPPSIAAPLSWRPPLGIYGPNELPLRFGG